MEQLKGRIFNIQKFSVHDGPGIRDIVFMKGCPLRCKWCANPESQKYEIQIGYQKSKCLGEQICGYCVKACPEAALQAHEEGWIVLNGQRCTNCRKCVQICPTSARRAFGEDVTVEEIYQRLQNQACTWRANGGVTISGGEPLMQAKFVEMLLRKLKANGIHTAIETSGYASWEDFSAVARWCDVIHMDLKILDSEKHQNYVGCDNQLILENLKKLCEQFSEKTIIIRTPVIPGINDDVETLTAIADFLHQVGNIQDYELLPYHAFGRSKYEQLQRDYPMGDTEAANTDKIHALNEQLRQRIGLKEGGLYHETI